MLDLLFIYVRNVMGQTMNKQEKIVCAAIEFLAEHSISKNQFSYVMCGIGYKEIHGLAVRVGCDPILSSKDGFITNHNRFVDAKEAWRIAKDADQVNPLFFEFDFGAHPELKPEYLY